MSRHALPAINLFEDHAEQQVDQLRHRRPTARPTPPRASKGFANRVKSVPASPAFGQEVVPADVGMVHVVNLILRLQPEAFVADSNLVFGNEARPGEASSIAEHLVEVLGPRVGMINAELRQDRPGLQGKLPHGLNGLHGIRFQTTNDRA